MRFDPRFLGACAFLVSLLPAQTPLGPCTGAMPVAVPTATATVGQLTCSAGFTGQLAGTKVQNAACPILMVITPAHSNVQYQANAPTDAKVNGQVPNYLVTFKCVGHYLLFVWLYDTCEVDTLQVAGNVDNYALVPCEPRHGSD